MKPETREKLMAVVDWFRRRKSPGKTEEELRAEKKRMLREAIANRKRRPERWKKREGVTR